MLYVLNTTKHESYQEYRKNLSDKETFLFEKILPLSLFFLIGGLGWAIRGTGGWGGSSGAMLAGLWWGMLFYYLGYVRGIDVRRQAVLLGFGIGFGGLNGYGQFIGWIQGTFRIGGEIGNIAIDPMVGYFNLLLVGIIWGGYGGLLFAWGLTKPKPIKHWAIRGIVIVASYFIGYYIVAHNPAVFYPNYDANLFDPTVCPLNCERTASTANLMGALMTIFIALFIMEILEKNKDALITILIITLAFALAFPLAALWFHAPKITDFNWSWWKQWEISIGCIGGLGIGIACLRLLEKRTFKPSQESAAPQEKTILTNNALLLTAGFSILSFYTLSGLSKGLSIYLGLVTSEDLGDESFPLARILILIPGLIAIGYHLIKSIKKVRTKRSEPETLFQLKSITYKLHLINFMISAAGVIAIGDNKMSFVYFLFYALMTLVIIFQTDFYRQKSVYVE